MKKYGRRFSGHYHAGSMPISINNAIPLAKKIRTLGRNVRIIPTKNGTRLYVSKQIRPYSRGTKGTGGKKIQPKDRLNNPIANLTQDPFANILTSSRNQRSKLVPVMPDKDGIIDSIIEAMTDGELEYMEYSNMIENIINEYGLTYEELTDSPDLNIILSKQKVEDLNETLQLGYQESAYTSAKYYMGNTYMPLLDSAIGWTDPKSGPMQGNLKEFTRDEIIEIAKNSKEATMNYQRMYEDSLSKRPEGRFSELRVSNSDYFGKPGIYEWLENNQVLIPFEIVKQVTPDEEKIVLFRMDQDAIQKMARQYKAARKGDKGTMGPEVDFLSRLGGEYSAFDADWYGGLTGVEEPFTFFDYLEIEHDQEDWVLSQYTDEEDGYTVIKSVLGVIGPDRYGGPDMKGVYEYEPGDEVFERLFPESANFFPKSYVDPMLGLRGLIWRDNIVLNRRQDLPGIQESLQVPFNTGIEKILDKITNDGYLGDPMAVLAYLTKGGISKLQEDDLDALVEFNVREKYGDPHKLYPSIKKASLGDKKASERLDDKNLGNYVDGWEYSAPMYPFYAKTGWEENRPYNASTEKERRTKKRIKQQEQVMASIERAGTSKAAQIAEDVNNEKDKSRGRRGGITVKTVAQRLTELKRQGRVIRLDRVSAKGTAYRDKHPSWTIVPGRRYEARHAVNENRPDPTSADALSKWILWNEKTKGITGRDLE